MPELPEVETVVRDLRPLVTGRRIRSVWVSDQSLRRTWEQPWTAQVVDAKIGELRRRGKWILMPLSSGLWMLVHLGMTGQFTISPTKHPLADHTHLRFTLSGRPAEELRFRDIRRFGSATLFETESELTSFLDDRLGPEPTDLKTPDWRQALLQTKRALKATLLDQKVVAGIGNIYADESLFAARLYPGKLACQVRPAEAERLRVSIGAVIERAITYRGSTIRNYVGGSGLTGGFQNEFTVYGRTGEPCVRCETPIRMMRMAGRSTHYCPRCQPETPKCPTARSSD